MKKTLSGNEKCHKIPYAVLAKRRHHQWNDKEEGKVARRNVHNEEKNQELCALHFEVVHRKRNAVLDQALLMFDTTNRVLSYSSCTGLSTGQNAFSQTITSQPGHYVVIKAHKTSNRA